MKTDTNSNEYAIQAENVCKSFGKLKVLENVSVNIKKGEVVSIIGGSGCGKSVFIRCLNRLEIPDSGRILLNGTDITRKGTKIDQIHRKVGMVYQNFNLFSNMNVMDNLCLAPTVVLKMPRDEAKKKAMEWLSNVSLSDKEKSMPTELSGGQKQRIAIARCMMMDPDIVFFDEPTSALDPTMVGEVLATIRMLTLRGITIVIVSHEWEFCREISDRILFMCEGGIYEQGTPEEIFEAPQKPRTIEFIQKMKFLYFQITSRNYDLRKLHDFIENFGQKYALDHKAVFTIMICVEELIRLILTAYEPTEENSIHLQLQYSGESKTIHLLITYPGEELNPFELTGDDTPLSILILSKKTHTHTWNHNDNDNMNTVELDL